MVQRNPCQTTWCREDIRLAADLSACLISTIGRKRSAVKGHDQSLPRPRRAFVKAPLGGRLPVTRTGLRPDRWSPTVAPKPHVLYCSHALNCRRGMPSVVWKHFLDGPVLCHRGFLSDGFRAFGTGCESPG